jgi:hypothetical protein
MKAKTAHTPKVMRGEFEIEKYSGRPMSENQRYLLRLLGRDAGGDER